MIRGWDFIGGLVAGALLAGAAFLGAVFGLAGTPTASTVGAAPALALKRELAAHGPSPKCLLVGGSGVDLGLSARRIEEQTGMPTRNFGLWVPLGLPFLLHQTRDVARAGDLVVLALEYELLDWPGRARVWADPQGLQLLFAEEAAYLRSRPWVERLQLALRLPLTWPLEAGFRARKPVAGGASAPKYTDAWGDRTDNARVPREVLPPAILQPVPQLAAGWGRAPKGLPELASFLEWAARHQVRVVATFPNLAAHEAYQTPAAQAMIRRLEEFYRGHEVPVLGSFAGALQDPKDCYDAPYHLVLDAVARRTDRLVEQLRDHLPKRAADAPAP